MSRLSAEEIEAARKYVQSEVDDCRIYEKHGHDVGHEMARWSVLGCALSSLAREPELLARIGELGRIGIKQEQRIASLEAQVARVQGLLNEWEREREDYPGKNLYRHVDELRAALDGEVTE